MISEIAAFRQKLNDFKLIKSVLDLLPEDHPVRTPVDSALFADCGEDLPDFRGLLALCTEAVTGRHHIGAPSPL